MPDSPQTAAYSRQQHARSHYQEMEITTADPFELILILYRGALQQLEVAKTNLRENRIDKRVEAINRALDMIGELKASLDFERGAQIAHSLDQLYGYMLRRLAQANLEKDESALDEVSKLLKTLETAWSGARSNLADQKNGQQHIELSA